MNGARCREYVSWRIGQQWRSAKPEQTGNEPRLVTQAAARRELEDLRAAINHHRREGLCSEIVRWCCQRNRGPRCLADAIRPLTDLGGMASEADHAGSRTNRAVGRHLARFILVGLYTGSRSGAICGAAL